MPGEVTDNTEIYKHVFPGHDNYNGFFFCHGVLDQTPVIKLRKAAGFDELTLPVSKEAVERLIKTEYIQLSGKKKEEEIMLDDSTGRIWEMQPNQILQKNKRWAHEVNKIKPHIKEDLGMQKDKIRFTINRLLIYEPGSFVTLQNDGEQEKNMIGTLVINLPSDYKGGDLVMKHHSGTEIRYNFGGKKCRLENTLFLALYGDVDYEITPITEGYRTAIIYNICTEEPEINTKSPPLSDEIKNIFNYLEDWAFDFNSSPVLSIMANHSYSENGLKSLYKLKGQDKMGLLRLKAACELFNYKYPSTGIVFALQLIEVHKFTDKNNRGASTEEVEHGTNILVVGPYDDINDPVYQETISHFQSYPIFPDTDLTSGKVVRREDYGPIGNEHPLEYWYRPTIMTILLKHKIQPVNGIKLYHDINKIPQNQRSFDNPEWRIIHYKLFSNLQCSSPDLQAFHLCLIAYVDGKSDMISELKNLFSEKQFPDATFSGECLIHMANILGWDNLVEWQAWLSSLSFEWAISSALTWSTFISRLEELNIVDEDLSKKCISTKDSLLSNAISQFVAIRQLSNLSQYKSPLNDLLVTLLGKENPQKKDAALIVLKHAPAIYREISMSYNHIELIVKSLPDFNIQEILNLLHIHTLLGIIYHIVTLEPDTVSRFTLREITSNYLSRVTGYQYRESHHNGIKTVSHEDVLLKVCPFLQNSDDIKYLLSKGNSFPLTFEIYKLLHQYIDINTIDDKIKENIQNTKISLDILFPFLDLKTVRPSHELSDIERQFVCSILRGLLTHPSLSYDLFGIFKCATIIKDSTIMSGILEFLRKLLLTSPLHGYARQDPASFIENAKEWAKNDETSIDRELEWLGTYINQEYEARVKRTAPSFGYEVNQYSYQSGFCDCKYCQAIMRFLKDAQEKDRIFRVAASSVGHIMEVLKNDAMIFPVLKVSKQQDPNSDNELLEIVKLSPLRGRLSKVILDQVAKIKQLISTNSTIESTEIIEEPPLKKQKLTNEQDKMEEDKEEKVEENKEDENMDKEIEEKEDDHSSDTEEGMEL